MFVSTREMLNQLDDAAQSWEANRRSNKLNRAPKQAAVESELHAVLRGLEENSLASESLQMLAAALARAQANVPQGVTAPVSTTH